MFELCPNSRQLARLIQAGTGSIPFDLTLRNCRIVNVYTGEITTGDIGMIDGRIAGVSQDSKFEARQTRDCGGLYAVPGFIDAHVHIESSLLPPAGFAALLATQGTTSLFVDPMEIANVAGLKGVQWLLDGTCDLPVRFFAEVSSRVPTAPGLETTGGCLGLEEVRDLLGRQMSLSLGELEPSKVLGLESEYLLKVQAAVERGKIANGHAAGLHGRQLAAYVAAGLRDDHECVTPMEMLERVRLGMKVMIREGSTERNLEALVKGAGALGIPTRHLMFCTDDKHPDEIVEEGHINYNVKKAIQLGLDPVSAIQMATLNPAEHFRVDHLVGSIAPGRLADILLLPDLTEVKPAEVYVGGRLVASNGKVTATAILPAASTYPDWLCRTVRLRSPAIAESFALPSPRAGSVRVRVIEVMPDQIVNRAGEGNLPVDPDGYVGVDPKADVLKIAVVERYGKTGGIGLGFIRGFGLTSGAIAGSVAHDHHNIVIVGTNDADMAACANAIAEMQGGFVVVKDGRVLGRLALPIGGLMSAESDPHEVIRQLQRLNAAAAALGCKLPSPFMTLSFVSLPTVPELGLTDLGLIDVPNRRIIPVWAE